MDRQFVSESIAHQLAYVWELYREPAFVDYLQQTFGCEPLKPVEFAGVFSVEMIGGYFYPDLPAGPGPIVERLWLLDDMGWREISLDEFMVVENQESDNPLVVYDASRTSHQRIGFQPLLFCYPRFLFCVRDNHLIYQEHFGYFAGCTKVGNLDFSDGVTIRDLCMKSTIWQGHWQNLRSGDST